MAIPTSINGLKTLLTDWFSWSARQQSEENLPYYFWRKEHFDAAEKIIEIRQSAISKQRGDYSEIEGDFGVIKRLFFGDKAFDETQHMDDDEVHQYKERVLEQFRAWPREEKKGFLLRVYKLFDDAMPFDKAATVQWFGNKHQKAEAIVSEMKEWDSVLAQHSVAMRTHSHDTDEVRDHVVLLNEANKLLSTFMLSTSSALNDLHFGYQAFSGLQNDALKVYQAKGEEFDAAFESYIFGVKEDKDKGIKPRKGIIGRLNEVSLSKVDSHTYTSKWEQRIKDAKGLIREIEQEQQKMLALMPQSPDVGDEEPQRSLAAE